jgi:hypothetical protein
MPFLSEHPYITTGLNFVYVYQRLPEGPVFDGGEAQGINNQRFTFMAIWKL